MIVPGSWLWLTVADSFSLVPTLLFGQNEHRPGQHRRWVRLSCPSSVSHHSSTFGLFVGLSRDLHLSSTQYQIALCVFFIGMYLVGEICGKTDP